MPHSSPSAPAVDPIELLSQRIAPAVKRKGSIKLATNLIKAVKIELKTARTGNTYVLDTSVVTIVSALDEHDETCSRLDSATFGIILQTLLHAKYSRQKERGILLLTASLHHDAHKKPALKTTTARKAAIGKECLQLLLSCFTNAFENARIRRWVGVLIPQLLDGSSANRMAFELGPEDSKRKLGTMVIEEPNEILRITCGQLLKALMALGIPPENLWPVGTDPMHYKKFPLSSQNEKHWNNAFQAYADEVFDSSKASQESSGRLYFAQALVVSPMGENISGGVINILVDRDVSICTQSNDVSFTQSIEIPFQLFSKAIIEDTQMEDAALFGTPPVDLVVELKASNEVSSYMNALPVNIGRLRITVKDEELANDMGLEFLSAKSTQKASQSKEAIAIASEFHDVISPQESRAVGDSNEERAKFRHDPTIPRPRGETQDDFQSVELKDVIENCPEDNKTRETDRQLNPELGEFVAEDIDSAPEPIYGDNQDEAGDGVPFRSPAPARLSRHTRNGTEASLDKENDKRQDVDLQDSVSKRARRGKPSLQPPTVPEQPSHEDSEEMTEPPASPVASPVAPAKPKTTSTRPKAKAKPKDKKAVPKPESPKEEVKRVKKYSLKPKAAAPIIKAAAPKRVAAPKTSALRASVSKAGPKVLAPKLASAFKPATVLKLDSIPKTASGLVAPAPKKTTSKLLVPKKRAVKDLPKRPIRQSQVNFTELDLKFQENRNAPARPVGHAAMNLDLGAQGVLMQDGRATNRHASRLSEALADIDDIEQLDASCRDLVQTSLTYQPQHVTTQTESSSPPVVQSTPTPAQEDANSQEQYLPEVIPMMSKSYANQPPHMELQSESSPSSLLRVTPVPLPAQEASPAEYFISEVTTAPSKILAGPIGPRRSPRLASRYCFREASVAFTSVPAVAPRLVRKPVVVGLSDNDEPKYKDWSSDDISPSRADEASLFDDHLARKTPLISFGAKGPRNQGISSSKKSSLQRIGRIRQVEELGTRPLPTQTHMRSGKRKRDKEDAPVIENNKRQQTSKLEKSKDKTATATKESPLGLRDAEDHIIPRNHPAPRNVARFGSQGSRVNENGSPRGHSNSFQEHINYKAIARKVLTDTKPTAMNSEDNGDAFFHYGDDEGLNMAESNHGFLLDLPVTSPSSFKVLPLSPRPDEEVVKRYLPRKKIMNLHYPEVETKVVHYQRDKLADPFFKESPEIDLSSIARRLQYRRQTPIRNARDDPPAYIPRKTRHTINEDPEATLVNVENEIQVREFSSSDMTSESTDEPQRDEWRMALKPYQRGILDALNQVSTDLVRHLINHEQAVEDVLTEYEQGGIKLIKGLEGAHQDDRRRIQHEVDKVKKTMSNGYKEARQEISRITKAIRARPVRELEKEWVQEQDQMQRLIEEGMRKRR